VTRDIVFRAREVVLVRDTSDIQATGTPGGNR